jgi:hypothetical protein
MYLHVGKTASCTLGPKGFFCLLPEPLSLFRSGRLGFLITTSAGELNNYTESVVIFYPNSTKFTTTDTSRKRDVEKRGNLTFCSWYRPVGILPATLARADLCSQPDRGSDLGRPRVCTHRGLWHLQQPLQVEMSGFFTYKMGWVITREEDVSSCMSFWDCGHFLSTVQNIKCSESIIILYYV